MDRTLTRIPLRVVFYQEGKHRVAHCLECNLAGHGKSNQEALDCLAEALAIQVEVSVEKDNLDNLLTPAGRELIQMFVEGEDMDQGPLTDGLKPIHIRKGSVVVDSDQYRAYHPARLQAV